MSVDGSVGIPISIGPVDIDDLPGSYSIFLHLCGQAKPIHDAPTDDQAFYSGT